MHFLVRKQTGRGSAEALETEYEGNRLTLGGAEGAMVQLPGLPGVVEITPKGADGASLRARGFRFELDGREVSKADLQQGVALELPGHRLELIAPPAGFDLALRLEATATAAVNYGGALELEQVIWSRRRSSWLLALLVLVLCLVVPAVVLFEPELGARLRSLPLPDDGMWSSGPLVAAHRTTGIGDDCQACHTEPFKMVQDEACLVCHREVNEHVDVTVHPAQHFSGERCASCHREHNEPQALVRRDRGLCVDCHAQPADWPDAEGMEAVSGFTEAAHPEFRLALLTPRGPGGVHGWQVDRVRALPETQRERSNLKFTHTVHMDVDKVQDKLSSEGLECASCHTLKDDGEHFEPVTMDAHCRSCHGLNFDSFEPELELPHGDLRAATVAMEAHFIREFTDPVLRQERAAKKPRRVPGKRDAAGSCEGSGLECGRREAMSEAGFQFAETGCVTCHEVTETGMQSIHDRWYVEPIKVTGDWYPHSSFDHSSHLSLAREQGRNVCETCHDASASEQAADILIPGRENCLGCHADNERVSAVDCVSCHVYHEAGATPALQARGHDTAYEPAGSGGE